MVPSRISETFSRRVAARKDEELKLADLILTCSSFAANSFISRGVPKEKVRVVPLGCDVEQFGKTDRIEVDAKSPIRFLFVGRLKSLKGADLLAAAAQRLKDQNLPFTLTIAAPLDGADPLILEALRPVARMVGRVPHEQLGDHYSSADCVITPSRFDSFNMVVAEALSSGAPVIVTDHVGAMDMVENDHNGWIVSAGELEPLFERMAWCARNPEAVRLMSGEARETATRWPWSRYRAELARTLDEFMARWFSEKAATPIVSEGDDQSLAPTLKRTACASTQIR